MMLTKQDYIQIAQIIALFPMDNQQQVRDHFLRELKLRNPTFKPERFIREVDRWIKEYAVLRESMWE